MSNLAKVNDLDYIQFLLAAQTAFSCVEASATHGASDFPPAHDAYTRLLQRQPPDTEALWSETQAFVQRSLGLLVLDDSTLDKPHARHIGLVHRHWSGKHHRSVSGINLVTLLWTDGGAKLPIDCRISNAPVDGVDKNQHFRAMLKTAKERGFSPECVCFDEGRLRPCLVFGTGQSESHPFARVAVAHSVQEQPKRRSRRQRKSTDLSCQHSA